MKKLRKILHHMMWFALIAAAAMGFYDLRKDNVELKKAIDNRAHLDTLYWNHLEQCAWETKDGKPDSKN